MGSEKRKFNRKNMTLNIKVRESGDDYSIDFNIKDLSEGGIFIKSSLLWEAGEKLDLVFSLPGTGRTIKVHGEVARAEDTYFIVNEDPHEDPIPGMGIKFIDISEEDRQAIRKFTAD